MLNFRNKVNLKWLSALLAPLKDLHADFKSFREKNIYRLNHNSQVVYMTEVLNDRFDKILRRIVIEDGLDTDALIIYRRDELKPVFVKRRIEADPTFLYRRSEVGGSFVVKGPICILYDVYEMRALIDQYRLASKNEYLIIAV